MMDLKKTSRLPLVFRVAAFYAFFSIFFLNAQPFVANWNDPFGLFLQKIYGVFSSTETNAQKPGEEIRPNGVYPMPIPPPPPPPARMGG